MEVFSIAITTLIPVIYKAAVIFVLSTEFNFEIIINCFAFNASFKQLKKKLILFVAYCVSW